MKTKVSKSTSTWRNLNYFDTADQGMRAGSIQQRTDVRMPPGSKTLRV